MVALVGHLTSKFNSIKFNSLGLLFTYLNCWNGHPQVDIWCIFLLQTEEAARTWRSVKALI